MTFGEFWPDPALQRAADANYRRNAAALKAMLISLGMAKKSRDVTKADMRMFDQHAAAILDME